MQQERFRDTVLGIAHRKSMSMRHIAEQMNVNHSQISRPINGVTSFKREWLLSLCRVLQCSHQEAIEIFNQTDYRPPELSELLDEEQPVLIAS